MKTFDLNIICVHCGEATDKGRADFAHAGSNRDCEGEEMKTTIYLKAAQQIAMNGQEFLEGKSRACCSALSRSCTVRGEYEEGYDEDDNMLCASFDPMSLTLLKASLEKLDLEKETMNEAITNYWLKYYTRKDLCSLCGNSGQIDTRGLKSSAGVECGDLHFCICPNGQASRMGALPTNLGGKSK